MLTASCLISSVCEWGWGRGGGVWGAGRGGIVVLCVGNNVMLFSLLYIAASHAVHVHYFSCVLLVVIHVCFSSVFCFVLFLNTLSLIFFSTLKMSENFAKRSEFV